MPTYTFECIKEEGGCGHIYETFMHMSDYNPNSFPQCPQCQTSKNVKRNFQEDIPNGYVACQTLGSVADKNTSSMSDDARLDLWRKQNAYKFEESEMKLPKGMKRLRKPTDLKPPSRKKRQVNARRK
jgi:predicted nucleic acid-binding Zn ribbon protein